MIATVAMSASQYHHTLNTLKYADRAKEIKTHVRRNQGSVAMHVAQMRAVIAQLQQQNALLKAMLTAPVVRSLPLPTVSSAERALLRQSDKIANLLAATSFVNGFNTCDVRPSSVSALIWLCWHQLAAGSMLWPMHRAM